MSESPTHPVTRTLDSIGRKIVMAVEEIGNAAVMIGQSLFWLVLGPRYGQPVRPGSVVVQMMETGIYAIPILTLLNAAIGVMLAIQGIYMLGIFGAENHVAVGVAFTIVREFAPLITGILIAGRTGSALAARLATMRINQELDALHVMGINPIRFLVVPSLFAMMIMVPLLTFYCDVIGLLAAGIYVEASLGITISAFFDQVTSLLSPGDLFHGLGKGLLFGVLICIIGVVNGSSVTGGAEGVGKVTTRSVVQAISAIVLTDMLFAYLAIQG